MDKKGASSSSSGGIGFIGLLTILFIAFKLLGIIEWSWAWVLSPLWIGVIVVVLLLAALFALYLWSER